jgi:hypothetical protein
MTTVQQIEELRGDLNAHRQGWVFWPKDVLAQKTALLAKLLQQSV